MPLKVIFSDCYALTAGLVDLADFFVLGTFTVGGATSASASSVVSVGTLSTLSASSLSVLSCFLG